MAEINTVSFALHIRPMFRVVDVQHMQSFGVLLDDYGYMSDPSNDHENAIKVYDTLRGNPPSMPPGGPYWTQVQLDIYLAWMQGGYQP